MKKTFKINLELSEDQIREYMSNPNMFRPSEEKTKKSYETIQFMVFMGNTSEEELWLSVEDIATVMKVFPEALVDDCEAMVYYGISEKRENRYLIKNPEANKPKRKKKK